ncbi:MAG: alpha/beta hydrolase [Candidatus Omnitrophota bacterium]|nr:alpha/beta hydrolase [Candidatus Omnitrophota bacterium]
MPKFKASTGITWNFDVDGQGEALLFIHGWGVDRRIWRQQTKYFSGRYRVVAVDLPGHGESSWVKINLLQMAQDLKALVEQLDLKEITVVGSSLGGLLALKFTELCPGNVRRMVFVGSIPKFSQSPGHPYGLNVAEMRKLGKQLEQAYPSMVNIFFRSLFTKQERASRRFKWLQKFRQADGVPMKQALVDYLDILEQEDLRHVLTNLRLPLQFINGTEDHICDKKTIMYLKSIQPDARFDFFADCGHFPFLSKPYEFNRVVEEFLT